MTNPNGYIKSKNGTPVEIVDASARERLENIENDYLKSSDKVTDNHINELIDSKLGDIEDGTY